MIAPTDIILFDGDCTFCNGWVKWISKRDSRKRFTFLPLAGSEGIALRERYQVPAGVDSIVLITGERAYTRSAAAWRVLKGLPGWGFVAWLLRMIPAFFRDLGYDVIARNRHRLGMPDECELPDR